MWREAGPSSRCALPRDSGESQSVGRRAELNSTLEPLFLAYFSQLTVKTLDSAALY